MAPKKGGLTFADRQKLDDLLLETINDILLDIFRNKSLHNMMLVMDEVYSLKWDEIPEKTETFELALQNILRRGHVIIEDLILENLYPKLGVSFQFKSGYNFSDYMEDLKKVSQAPIS